MTNKIVITGGLGFMGSDLVRYLDSRFPEVKLTIVDNFAYSSDKRRVQGLEQRIRIVEADIRDFDAMQEVTRGAKIVFNFAAESHNDNSLIRPLDFVSTNVHGVANLLEVARNNGFRLHQVSTDEVFGDMEVGSEVRFSEISYAHPSSPYSASKAASENLCFGWHRSFGVDVTISNSANNFGPYQHPEKLIPRSIELIASGLKPKIYGDGSNVRDWIHVRDHSRAVWKIATKALSGSRYVVSAHDLVSNLELVKCINESLGLPQSNFEFISDRPGHDRQYASDSSKMRLELGWQPKESNIRKWISENAKNIVFSGS